MNSRVKKVLVLLHPGFEEIEAVVPMDLLRRAGVEVVSASLGPDLGVTGGRGIIMQADILASEIGTQEFDMLLLPGGPGVKKFRKESWVLDWVRKFHREGRFMAAICAAPLVLLDAGVLSGKKVASFPGTEEELRGHVLACVDERVCVDGKLITSRGAGTSEEFSLALILLLMGDAVAEDVRHRIVAR